MIKINTSNILFICGGAFDGIDKVIARRINTNSIGFGVNKEQQELQKKNMLQFINAQDLKGFGLIPELLGRLPVVTHLEPLDVPTLRAILTEPKNSLIKQYTRLFELEGIKLEIDEEVLNFMVSKAMEFKLGARGLRSICEHILTEAMFELPGSDTKEFHVTMSYAEQQFDKSKMGLLKVA
jgi:ATP-dependent Clp protease ATP-binding subunit ClpX